MQSGSDLIDLIQRGGGALVHWGSGKETWRIGSHVFTIPRAATGPVIEQLATAIRPWLRPTPALSQSQPTPTEAPVATATLDPLTRTRHRIHRSRRVKHAIRHQAMLDILRKTPNKAWDMDMLARALPPEHLIAGHTAAMMSCRRGVSEFRHLLLVHKGYKGRYVVQWNPNQARQAPKLRKRGRDGRRARLYTDTTPLYKQAKETRMGQTKPTPPAARLVPRVQLAKMPRPAPIFDLGQQIAEMVRKEVRLQLVGLCVEMARSLGR